METYARRWFVSAHHYCSVHRVVLALSHCAWYQRIGLGCWLRLYTRWWLCCWLEVCRQGLKSYHPSLALGASVLYIVYHSTRDIFNILFVWPCTAWFYVSTMRAFLAVIISSTAIEILASCLSGRALHESETLFSKFHQSVWLEGRTRKVCLWRCRLRNIYIHIKCDTWVHRSAVCGRVEMEILRWELYFNSVVHTSRVSNIRWQLYMYIPRVVSSNTRSDRTFCAVDLPENLEYLHPKRKQCKIFESHAVGTNRKVCPTQS